MLLTGFSILLEFAALVALRIREPELPRPYRVPGGLPVAIGLGVLPLALLILPVVRNEAGAQQCAAIGRDSDRACGGSLFLRRANPQT